MLRRTLFVSLIYVGGFAFGLPNAASANTECATLDDDAARLACYDAAYRPATVSTPESVWLSRTETSPIDDTTNVFLSVEAEESIPGRFGESARPMLILRCSENTTSAFLVFAGHHMADIQGYGDVTFRIDDRPAFERGLQASTDNEALGFWNGGGAIPFIKELFGGRALLVRATPYGESAITFTVPIAGVEKAVDPLREACHW